ncbi:MAG: succinate dehydrogenase iron-sulfur subunit [Chloroflexota bacterium]|nr:succinate dehydrogenase iron-sulfur subunit [Chloroflexota bacterium]
MQAKVNVRRFNPDEERPKSYTQQFDVEVEEHFTVLDTLIKVREEIDGSLALRCSCRAAICGSCAMRVNGHAVLACKARVSQHLSDDGQVTVEPAGNQPVIKDLDVDQETFLDNHRPVHPYLQPANPEPEAEYLAPNEVMLHLVDVMGCIMCGACVSDCTVLEVDPNFLGPAALAKAYRFVADTRDEEDTKRLGIYNAYGGIWDCTRCGECVQACPKGVAPMDRIMALREKAVESGTPPGSYEGAQYGYRHSVAFEEIITHKGRLEETQLVVKTLGMFNLPKLLGMAPMALSAMFRRKMPPPITRAAPGVGQVRRLANRIRWNRLSKVE